MATWAKGIDFKNSANTARVGGVGIYGTDTSSEKLYIGLGTEPWNNSGLQITSSSINFKGNKIYHAGDKPTPADIGAASSSHTHSYLPLSGGTMTGATVISGHNGLIVNGSKRAFWYHNNQHVTVSAGGDTGDLYLGFNSGTDYQTKNVRLESPMNWKGGATIVDSNGNVPWSIIGNKPTIFTGLSTATTEDWNTLNSTGIYSISNFSGTNSPSGAYQWGGLLSFRHGYATNQIYLSHSNNEMWIRGGWNGTYNTSWSRVYTTSYKPSVTDIGAAAASHNHDGVYMKQTNANGYYGMTANGDSSNWVRTTVNGIIPYQSGGSGSLGTSSWPFTNIYANNIYDNGILLENLFSPISHTHNYAGSSSAGGAATTALTCTGNSATATTSSYLGASSRMDYGWNGVNYFNISGTAGAAAKANDTPSTAWWHIMRFNHANSTGYYTDLAVPFNDVSLYYKRITAGSVQNGGWVKVLDSLNYNSYAPTKTGGGASGTWGISVTGNSATTTKLATARTLTIGNTGKNFDGTGNVAWSLAEIGAAASNHSHSYLPLSGGTVSGNFIVNSSKVPALATKVSSSELFTTKITVAGDYTAWANQTALSGVIITQNGITTPGISSGAIDASGESRFFNQTYSDPWNGTSCAIKATGYIASTHSIMSKGKFILGNSPNMYGGLGYDTTSGDVYVANAVNNWLRLKSNQTMTYAGYEVFTSKDRGNIMTVATRISNLNVKLNSGWYAWSNNATGRPADYGVMLVIQWGSDGDFCQIAVSTGNSMWTRWYVNNAWTSWIGH